MEINQDLRKRYDQLKAERSTVEHMWDAIETFVTPFRGSFFRDTKEEGSIDWFRQRQSYDSTATMAHQNLAASIHGAITNPGARWFELGFREPELKEHKDSIEWLQKCADITNNALQDSNFNVKINEAYQDLAGPGTTFVIEEELPSVAGKFGGIEFHSAPLRECVFETDYQGRVIRFYRKLEWTPAQIISKFGAENVPAAIVEMDGKGNDTKQDLIYCVHPRNNRVVPIGGKLSASRRPFEFRYIWMKGNETVGKPGGVYEMPVFAPRWRLTAGSIWGNSPAHLAMQDILSLNEAMQIHLISMEKLMDPAIFAEESAIISDLDLSAAALSVVRDIGGIKPFETKADLRANELTIGRLQAGVRNYFLNDQLNFPDPQAQPMTATEAQIRYDLMQRLLGPTLGRIQTELLHPLISRTFRILARAGVTPKPPQRVIDLNPELDIEYSGSLTRAQRMDTAMGIQRYLAMLAEIAGTSSSARRVLDHVDYNAVAGVIQREMSVPASIIRDKDDAIAVGDKREESERAIAEAQIQQEQNAAQQPASEAA